MNSIYPTNLPGFVYYHDPTKLNYKKSSMLYQDKKNMVKLNSQNHIHSQIVFPKAMIQPLIKILKVPRNMNRIMLSLIKKFSDILDISKKVL
jgi:hypothetical protein